MVRTNTFAKFAVAAFVVSVARGGGPDVSPFDAVKDGVFAVYPIDDLTRQNLDQSSPVSDPPAADGQPEPTGQANADRIDSLVRETIAVGQWTTTGGHEAAMRATPDRLTVKASAETQRQIGVLIAMLHDARRLAFDVEFRIIQSDSFRPVRTTPAERTGPDARAAAPAENFFEIVGPAGLPADAKTLLAPSRASGLNGQRMVWLDGVGTGLPTITGRPTVTADRRFVGSGIVARDGNAKALRTNLIVPLGATAAVALDAKAGRWLLFTATLTDRTPRPAT